MNFYRMLPTGPDIFESEKDYCAPQALLERDDLEAMFQTIVDGFLALRHEDDDLCLAVQRGPGSRHATTAPRSHRENTIARFARRRL